MAAGDERERAEMVGREALAYADGLYNLARYLTKNESDAEDLVQDTYGRAIRSAAQFTPGSNLKAWLFRILRNSFVSHYRRERHNPITGGLDTVAPRLPVPDDIGRLRDSVEIDRLRKAAAEDIERALLALSEDARTVILLDLEGLNESETALVIGCAVGTVKSRLSRARAALRQTLREWEP
jgi:RNA polymerase sigma-70 factor (ECF subfamily)